MRSVTPRSSLVSQRGVSGFNQIRSFSSKPGNFANYEKVNEYINSDPKLKEAIALYKQIQPELQRVAAYNEPKRIAVTGAAGSIGYSILFRIASGEMLGKQQPVILQLLEIPEGMKSLEGVAMELRDCAFPTLAGIEIADDPRKGFKDADYALLIGAKPRKPGQERGDLLKENAQIFAKQGKALNDVAGEHVKILVVGNPANTNAMITSAFAPRINPKQITAMTQLDHNRGLSQLALKAGVKVSDIARFCVWGNHSATQYPDITNAQINGKWAKDLIKDEAWIKDVFIPTVQNRGAEILKVRGLSSAASAASAAIDHMRYWSLGTKQQWTSMAVRSDGIYGVDPGLWYSFPVVCEKGEYLVVGNVPVPPFSAERMELTRKELLKERDMIKDVLKGTSADPDAPQKSETKTPHTTYVPTQMMANLDKYGLKI